MSKLIIDTLNNDNVNYHPVWFMRQAGRFLPGYREIRSKHKDFFDMCINSDVACEISMLPIKELDVDGVIVFSDILVVLREMGVKINFIENQGPLVSFELEKLLDYDIAECDFSYVYNTIKSIKKSVHQNKTIIGFSGSPFNLCCYLIDGGRSYSFQDTRRFFLENPTAFQTILNKITIVVTNYLCEQYYSGADVVMLFDSHCSFLNENDFANYVINPTNKIIAHLKKKNIPAICFPMGSGIKYVDFYNKVKPECISFDYMSPIKWVNDVFSKQTCVQGNLDPIVLATDINRAINDTKNIINHKWYNGLIFNTGHGILPFTPIDNVKKIIELVRSCTISL